MAFKLFKGCDILPNSVEISLIDYTEKEFHEERVGKIEDCLPFKGKNGVTWINVDGVHDVELIGKIGKLFDLHLLTVEDIVNPKQCPKKKVNLAPQRSRE